MKKNLFLAFVILLCCTAHVHAANWYVDNAATGSNNGTSWANAWTRFGNIAWAAIQPGDTIYISGGAESKTYSEKLDVRASGSPGAPILIMAGQSNGHNGQVIISNPSGIGITIYSRSYVVINGNYSGQRNLRVTGCYDRGLDIGSTAHHNIITYLEIDNNGHSGGINQDGITANFDEMSEYPVLEISYCKVHNNWQDQIHIVGVRGPEVYGRILIHHNEIFELQDDGIETGIRGMDIYNNTMHTLSSGKGSGHPDGIVIMAGYGRIWNNTVYNLQSQINYTNAYIYPNIYNSVPTEECCIRIFNNLVYQTLSGRSGDYGRGIELSVQGSVTYLSDVLIANNTIVGMPAWGMNIYSGSNSSGITILNNIIHNCYKNGGGQAIGIGDGSYSVGSYGSGANLIFDYNIISAGSNGSTLIGYKGSIYNYDVWKSKFGVQSNISGNPDPQLSPSYRLSATSPANAAGTNLRSFYTSDKIGVLRPSGPRWSIGAYESGNNSSNLSAPSGFKIQQTNKN
jgi:hypothetical protein